MTRGLLGRLTPGAESGAAGRGVVTDIVAHLRSLLNTRQGCCALDPTYGVPDFTDHLHSFPEGAAALERMLRTVIARYEPRLSQLGVRSLRGPADALSLHFEISARMADDPRREVRFATHVRRNGHIDID